MQILSDKKFFSLKKNNLCYSVFLILLCCFFLFLKINIFAGAGSITTINPIIELVSSFDLIAGCVLCVWGTIVLAGALKEKAGPALQSGIWQIVGGLMIVFCTYMFKNMARNGDNQVLNNTFKYGGYFAMMGGAFWAVWGVIILASALKDKTGPALQSAIWQIVGGVMIMMASTLFVRIAYTA